MLIVQGTVRVRAEDVERVRAAVSWYAPTTRAEEGCIHYALAHDMLDPTLLHVIERWVDEAAFDAHVASAHVKRINEFMSKIGPLELNLRSYIAHDENLMAGG